MANIPDGTYGVTVTQTPAASGTLVVSGNGSSATYQVTGANGTAPTVHGLHVNTQGVGWNVTVTFPGASSSCTLNFSGGTYSNGSISGGKVTGSCITHSAEAVEDDWSATGPGSNVAATKTY